MKIEAFAMLPMPEELRTAGVSRIQGMIKMPQGSRIVHVAAAPPRGEMFVYCEVAPVATPLEQIDVVVLMVNDVIPHGYEYMGYILAHPILFIYRRKKGAIVI